MHRAQTTQTLSLEGSPNEKVIDSDTVVPRLKCRQFVEHCELSFLQRIQPASSPLFLRDIPAHSLVTLVIDLRPSSTAMGLE